MIRLLIYFGFFYSVSTAAYSQIPAFPGADGFGKFASGGRGGRVIEVTNLNDDGPGSLREALYQTGSRTIVFRISGSISLKSVLKVTNGDLTIAGQTAPGEGICIKDNTFELAADNVIIRFIRFRLGDESRVENDAFTVMRSKNVIVDHCSMSWGIDEVASMYDNENTTMQWCIISESLNHSLHHKGEHGFGGIWGGKKATFHHNLLAHNSSRNPRFQGARKTGNPDDEHVDFRNNVIFNWGYNSAYAGEKGRYNMVGNYYKPGPASIHRNRIVEPWDDESRWYIDDNLVEGDSIVSKYNWKGGVQGDFGSEKIKVDKPFEFIMESTDEAQEAFLKVLASAGASYPHRDAIDRRLVKETKYGKPLYEGKYYRLKYPNLNKNSKCGIIDSQKEVGGWPKLKSSAAPKDSDRDCLPDYWELNNALDPKNPNDAAAFSANGYTYLENYLNSLCK